MPSCNLKFLVWASVLYMIFGTTNVFFIIHHSLWKIWLVESIQSIHNSLWTWHDKYNICWRYCIYHVKFNVCLVTKPLECSPQKQNGQTLRFCFWGWILWKKCIIKQLLNSVFAWYHELSKPRVCLICLRLRLRQITQTLVLIIHVIIKMINNFLVCDWFKKVLFSTNSFAKFLSDSLLLDSLLLDSLLSDSLVSQSHSKM